jgi:hypothetical protein
MEILSLDFTHILTRLNELLSSAIIILTFSLFTYMLFYNLRSSIGRGFAVLLACMCLTYIGDVALFNVNNVTDAIPWLKFPHGDDLRLLSLIYLALYCCC